MGDRNTVPCIIVHSWDDQHNYEDFELAESFGAIGYSVRNTEEFSRVLKKAKESTHIPVIVSIDVDYSGNRILLDDNFRG